MTGPSIARGIIGQAQPILVGQLALMAYAVVDTVLTGHASAVDLATMGLRLSVYSTVFASRYIGRDRAGPSSASFFPSASP